MDIQTQTPDGYCECGCGGTPELAKTSNPKTGRKKGERNRFIRGHNARKRVRYVEASLGYGTPCWIFQLAKDRDGYGVCTDGRARMTLAHRVAWEAEHGPIPDGLEIDHLCRQRDCVNPVHLDVVTHQENLRRAGKLRLSDDDVRAIRRDTRPHKIIAVEFGTTQPNVSRIKNRLSRRSVCDKPPEEKPPSEKGGSFQADL